MRNDTLMFQHIYSGTEAWAWCALTLPRHLRYCFRHQMDFEFSMADPAHPEFQKHDVGHWAIPYLLRQFMERDYKWIIYMDHDAFVVDMAVDLREACVQDKIGMVWHDLAYHKPDWSHFNDGVLYVSNTPLVRAFVDEWLAGYPGDKRFPWLEQGTLNRLGAKRGIINRIDNKWNAGHVSPAENKVVWGLHGMPDRLGHMKLAVEEVEREGKGEVA